MKPQLHQTRQALFELRSLENQGVGMHLGANVAVGMPGLPIGEVMFDPSRHPASAIDPFSMMESLTGTPHVTQVMPYRPTEMNVVLHQNDETVTADWLKPVHEHKRALAHGLVEALEESKQIPDRTNYYVVGAASNKEVLPNGAEIIGGTDSPEAAAQAVAEICLRGLTFVISDFENLPLGAVTSALYPRAIAIKANHQVELQIPANAGLLQLDGLGAVETWKVHKLQKKNKQLRHKHTQLEQGLGNAGLYVAQAVYSPQRTVGTNVQAADNSIARAIRSAS